MTEVIEGKVASVFRASSIVLTRLTLGFGGKMGVDAAFLDTFNSFVHANPFLAGVISIFDYKMSILPWVIWGDGFLSKVLPSLMNFIFLKL